MGPVLYPKEIYGIVLYLIFSMSFYITFKKKTLACGSQVGHIWIVLWVKWVNTCDPLSTLYGTPETTGKVCERLLLIETLW